MATWPEFRAARPDLAGAGRDLLYQFGVGLAFLATVRVDGGPRLHPICPLLTDDGIYAFLVPSPKRVDLGRDGRYALHSFPTPENEDAVYLTGTARPADEGLRERLGRQFLDERPQLPLSPAELEDQQLFEFDIEVCLYTRTTGHGDAHPDHTIWRDPLSETSTSR